MFHASVTAKKLALNNKLSTDAYKKINSLPVNDIIIKNIENNDINDKMMILLLKRPEN